MAIVMLNLPTSPNSLPRVALIVATHFGAREVREHTGLSGRPLGYFAHSQGFSSGQDVAAMLEYIVKHHATVDPGLPTDLIFANSDVGYPGAHSVLKALEGAKLSRGVVRTFTRPNIGLSFGAYSDAFMSYRNEYDYFIFTEDDVLIGRNLYSKIGVDTFHQISCCGFLAYIGVSKNHHVKGSHAAGGTGLSSTKVLNQVTSVYGHLPHHPRDSSGDRWAHIRYGEIAFTNDIEKLGFEIAEVPKHLKLYDYTYDVMRGIRLDRRYATPMEALVHYSKRFVVRVFRRCGLGFAKRA